MAIDLLATFLLMLSPLVELRGGVPLGLLLGLNPVVVVLLGMLATIVIYTVNRFLLDLLSLYLVKLEPFNWVVRRTRKLWEGRLSKFGLLGLGIFVAVPLPMTGVWTGTLVSWIFGIGYMKALTAVLCGSTVIIVVLTLSTLGVISVFQ